MSGYTANNVLERVWNDSADEEDIFGDEFDEESDEDYCHESGPHRGEKMACSESVNSYSPLLYRSLKAGLVVVSLLQLFY